MSTTWTAEGLILKAIAADAGSITAYTPEQVEAAFQYAATILANSALADEPVEEFISTVCASALLNIQLYWHDQYPTSMRFVARA